MLPGSVRTVDVPASTPDFSDVGTLSGTSLNTTPIYFGDHPFTASDIQLASLEAKPTSVVNGNVSSAGTKLNEPTIKIRQDAMDRSEQLMEREQLLSPLFRYSGAWVDAERDINGDWVIKQTQYPTQDQLDFKGNFDKVNSSLWGHLSENQMINLSSSLVDKGIYLNASKIDIGSSYMDYKSLLNNGSVKGRNTDDFTNWLAKGGR